MIVLAIDTASDLCAACVFDAAEGRELARSVRPMTTGHATAITVVIDEALAAAGKTYRDIGRIAATTGPGSFTGVRIAVAAARGLALALDIPSIGVGVLEALAEPVRRDFPGRAVMATIDARRGEVYVMAWSPDGLPIAGPAALDIAAARAVAVGNDAVLTGSGAPVLTADGREHVVAGTAAAPDIGAVARLALRGEVRSPATPLYLRKPDAKVQAGYALPRKSP